MVTAHAVRVPTRLVVVTLLAAALSTAPAGAAKRKKAEDLVNVFLGPAYSQWLVGPISRVADDSEIEAYLALDDDAAAESFIEEFWTRRGGEGGLMSKGPRAIYEERAAEADKLYSEGAYLGRRTDRGILFVLYGSPAETEYQMSNDPRNLTLEHWIYPRDAEPGLDGEQPKRSYWFAKKDDLTVLHPPPRGRRRVP